MLKIVLSASTSFRTLTFTLITGKKDKKRQNFQKMEKKMTFSHDSKITVQVFNTFLAKFPQIITNLTEDAELAFIERLERLYLIMTLLIVFLSHILQLCC